MTIEQALYAVLSPLCPRVFPDVAAFDTARPYVTWQQIGGQALMYTEGAMAANQNAFVQINVWADTRAAANTLARQIEAALVASASMQAEPLSALTGTVEDDIEPRRYGAMQDFSIWAPRA